MGCFDNIDAFRESKRYLNKENTVGVRDMYSKLWNEYINMYGVMTNYYRNGYNIHTQDNFIYGEDATEPFKEPKSIVAIVEYQSDAILLSKFGIQSDADLIGVISIADFQNAFGLHKEPKPGDVIELVEAGWEASEMPVYDNILNEYNIIYNIDTTPIYTEVMYSKIAPITTEWCQQDNQLVQYSIQLYTATEAVTGETYPINIPFSEISGTPSDTYLKIAVSGGSMYYYSPLLSASPSGTELSINETLYIAYDIVRITGGTTIYKGGIPFNYIETETLMMPLYELSGNYTEEVLVSNSDNIFFDLDAKTLLCKYKDPSTVANITATLSGLYCTKYIRCPHLYEITEVKYQDFNRSGINFGQGHHAWYFNAKRFEYSFEPSAPVECSPNNQVYDNTFFGTISSFNDDPPPTPPKQYEDNVEDESETIWDYDGNGTNTEPYGGY